MSDMPHPSDASVDTAQSCVDATQSSAGAKQSTVETTQSTAGATQSSSQTDEYQNALRDVEQAREALRQAQERLDKTLPAPPTGQPVVFQQPYYYQVYSQQPYQQPAEIHQQQQPYQQSLEPRYPYPQPAETYYQQPTGTYQQSATGGSPEQPPVQPPVQPPMQPPVQPHYAAPYVSPKDHVAAGLLAIFLGFLGIHKFYLGYNVQGFIMLAISVIGGPLLFGLPFGVMWVIAIIEGVIYLSKNQTDFERMYVYNKQEWF